MTISTEDLRRSLALAESRDVGAQSVSTEAIVEILTELIAARAKIEAAQGALENIVHMGHDCPATFAGDEADWQAVRARLMQAYAKSALAAWKAAQ